MIRVEGNAAGCGGIKFFGTSYGEIKRMYIRPRFRGSGLGKMMLNHLTEYARQQGVGLLRLETGDCFGLSALAKTSGRVIFASTDRRSACEAFAVPPLSKGH